MPFAHFRNSVIEPYAKVWVTGAPSIARRATLLPPWTLIETPPFDGVAVSWPRNEYLTMWPLFANDAGTASKAAESVARKSLVRIEEPPWGTNPMRGASPGAVRCAYGARKS